MDLGCVVCAWLSLHLQCGDELTPQNILEPETQGKASGDVVSCCQLFAAVTANWSLQSQQVDRLAGVPVRSE
jgi:hypothetical protein